MATFERHVDVDWKGSVMEGKGEAKAGSGAFTLPVTFPNRIGDPGGQDEPRGADGGGACRVLRDGAERHARPQEASADRTVVTRDGDGRQGRRRDQDRVVEADRDRLRPQGSRRVAVRGRSRRKPKAAARCRTRIAGRWRSRSTRRSPSRDATQDARCSAPLRRRAGAQDGPASAAIDRLVSGSVE